MIRRAQEDELERLHAIAADARVHGFDARALGEELARPHANVLVSGPEAGEPEAFAVVWAVAGEGTLLVIAVEPGARRRGIGRSLLAAAEAWAYAHGAEKMLLE